MFLRLPTGVFALLLAIFLLGIGLSVSIAQDRTVGTIGKNSNVLPKVKAHLFIQDVEYEIFVTQGSTAYDLLEIAAKQYGLRFEGRDFMGLGFFVEELDGVAENPREQMHWIYYINNEKAKVGVSSYVIQPNDVIQWRYEKSEF